MAEIAEAAEVSKRTLFAYFPTKDDLVLHRFADHEEVYNAGDVYYVLPGHTPVIGEDTEYVEFSPLDRYHQTMEAVGRNMAAMQQQA